MLPTSSDSLQSHPNMPRRRSRCRTDPATVANPLTQTFDVDYLLDCYFLPQGFRSRRPFSPASPSDCHRPRSALPIAADLHPQNRLLSSRSVTSASANRWQDRITKPFRHGAGVADFVPRQNRLAFAEAACQSGPRSRASKRSSAMGRPGLVSGSLIGIEPEPERCLAILALYPVCCGLRVSKN